MAGYVVLLYKIRIRGIYMTELETIQRAKMYMDKLAKGINPIDDTPVPENDTANNMRLSKCFTFVASVLQRVIDQGGLPQVPQTKISKTTFCLADTQKREFAFSDEAIPISEIAKRINALIDTNVMQKITYQQIRAWLSTIGMLEDAATISGGRTKHPTEAGMSLGISVERRRGVDGDYQVVLYSRSAQQFILDNIEAVVPMRIVTETPEKRGQPWTKEQENQLIEMHNNGVPIPRIAYAMQRSSSGIRSRLKKLGLIANYVEEE